MKRAYSQTLPVLPTFEDASFFELVNKINRDCYSTSEDIVNYYKSKGNVSISFSFSSEVVVSLMDDLLNQVSIKSQDLEKSRYQQSISDLSNLVEVLEEEKIRNISIINHKNVVIENLAHAFVDLEQSRCDGSLEIRDKNDIIEDLYNQVEELNNENLELAENLDNLKSSHRRSVEKYGDVIELVNREYEEKLDKLKIDYQLLFEKNVDLVARFDAMSLDFKNKLEYAEMAGLSSISVLEETIQEKDLKLGSLGYENEQLIEKIRTCRKKISELEGEVHRLSLRLKNYSFKPNEHLSQSISSTGMVSSPPCGSRSTSPGFSPVLTQVCQGLVGSTLQNHGVFLKNFKVDYKIGRILGYDDIKTPLKTDDICIECGKGMSYDVTEARRYNRGVFSDLNGVIHKCGRIHTSCRNLIKYVQLNLVKAPKNEQ